MDSFEYFAPTRVVFGSGAERRAGELMREFGARKALVVYGGGSVRRSGVLDRVLTSLDEHGVGHVTLGGVVPNPRLSLVYEGIELCLREQVDFILAVGGGSVIDTGKAIGYGVAEPEHDVWEIYDRRRKPKACLPVGVVLTIAAAGSEMSNSSVITNEETGDKRGCGSNLSRPKFALMNPELTCTLPDWQTQSGCADIMMHTMERWFSPQDSRELTDSIAAGLLRTVMGCAKVLHDDPTNVDARAEVMWASSLSHNDLTGCGGVGRGDWMCHGIEHELGGMFDVTHGAGLAAVWGAWARYVHKGCLSRFSKFGREVMGVVAKDDEEAAIAGICAMEDHFRSVGMPVTISELGIEPTEEQLREMAHRCIVAKGGPSGTAMLLDETDVYNILAAAL